MRALELPVACPGSTEGVHRGAVGRQLVDVVLAGVGYVHTALRVGHHVFGFAHSVRREGAQKPALRGELLDAVVTTIGHPDIAF